MAAATKTAADLRKEFNNNTVILEGATKGCATELGIDKTNFILLLRALHPERKVTFDVKSEICDLLTIGMEDVDGVIAFIRDYQKKEAEEQKRMESFEPALDAGDSDDDVAAETPDASDMGLGARAQPLLYHHHGPDGTVDMVAATDGDYTVVLDVMTGVAIMMQGVPPGMTAQ